MLFAGALRRRFSKRTGKDARVYTIRGDSPADKAENGESKFVGANMGVRGARFKPSSDLERKYVILKMKLG